MTRLLFLAISLALTPPAAAEPGLLPEAVVREALDMLGAESKPATVRIHPDDWLPNAPTIGGLSMVPASTAAPVWLRPSSRATPL